MTISTNFEADDCLVPPDSLETVRQKLFPYLLQLPLVQAMSLFVAMIMSCFLCASMTEMLLKKLHAGEPAKHSAIFQSAC